MNETSACLHAPIPVANGAAIQVGIRRPFALDDLFALQRLADPQVSPDGSLVAYTVTTVSVAENKKTTNIWLAPTGGGDARLLTNAGFGKHDTHPRFSPDSRRILFVSDRTGESQLWVIDVAGGEATQVTSLFTGADDGIWSPDGQLVAFVSDVRPEFSQHPFATSDAMHRQDDAKRQKSHVQARVMDKMFYRHWASWVDGKRKHLFVMRAPGQAGTKMDEPKDITPGDWDAYPTSSTFAMGDDFTFSPNSQFLVFAAPPAKDEARSTNYRILRVSVDGGPVVDVSLTDQASASGPRFSPDGSQLAYRVQERPGYEADRWSVWVVPTDADGQPSSSGELAVEQDRSVAHFAWAGSDIILFSADQKGTQPIFQVELKGSRWVQQLGEDHSNSSLTVSADGKTVAYSRSALGQPPEIITAKLSKPGVFGALTNRIRLGRENVELLSQLDLPQPESVFVSGARKTPMHMWILKPPGFDAAKKWPLAFLVHGGPQGAWDDAWSWRWNAALWAAQGYVVALPNPRGSTGYGQQYTDQICQDWGGKCFQDLMAGLAYMEEQPYIDSQRMAAAGASFGGYMMNWFQGHCDKFKALITHCGVFNLETMIVTDEMWFHLWECGGMPWQNPQYYAKHSPHRLARKFRTPNLIIHNDLDFRVPMDQGWQLLNTLLHNGVDCKMINYQNEGHWVNHPANSQNWHEEVFAWLARYAPPGGRDR